MVAIVVGLRLARCSRTLGNDFNRRPGDDRSAFVGNGSGKTAGRLSVHDRRNAKPNYPRHHHQKYFLAHHHTPHFLLWLNEAFAAAPMSHTPHQHKHKSKIAIFELPLDASAHPRALTHTGPNDEGKLLLNHNCVKATYLGYRRQMRMSG